MDKIYYRKHILMTGGLGFIGSNLAIRLTQLGAKVTIVDSLIEGYRGNIFNIEPVKDKVKIDFFDIRNIHDLEHVIPEQVYIFNLAGQVSHIDSMRDPLTGWQPRISLREGLQRTLAYYRENLDRYLD